MTTVWIYVDTSKDVGDPEHLKVFANEVAAQALFAKYDPEGVTFEYGGSAVNPVSGGGVSSIGFFLILKSSIRLPEPNCAASQRGCLPRPAQVSEG
jgi:hypothetical protein